MATRSSVLAWRIPGMGEPGGLLSLGSHRVGHHWSDLAAAAAVSGKRKTSQKPWAQSLLKGLSCDCAGLACGSDGKESACNAGGSGSNAGWERSPGEGNGRTLQYSWLKEFHGQRSLAGYNPWGHKESVYRISCHLHPKTVLPLLFQFGYYLFLFLFWFLWLTSNTMLKRSDKSGHPYLIPEFSK